MKKPYSLDYTIESDIDRMQAVRSILDSLPIDPSPTDLETMASYVLYGKDENGKNAIQRKEIDDRETKRYSTFKTKDEKNESLDAILENPLNDQTALKPYDSKHIYTKKHICIRRPKFDKQGNLLDIGDGDIPGMEELWEAIDHLEHTYNANKGLVDFNADDTVITDTYRLWQLNHMLIDLRRHQYYLRDYYKPTLHFNAVMPSATPTYNWDSDTFYWLDYDQWCTRVAASYNPYVSKNLEDYETREQDGKTQVKWVVKRHNFDWENPHHIKGLINNYSDLYMQVWDKLDSWGRTLIYDFDRYFEKAHFSELREYVLTRKIDKATTAQITKEVQEKFGIKYNENSIGNIINKEIPRKMAETAARERLIKETPLENCKVCAQCGRALPASPLFFIRNKTKAMGVESSCKECQRKARILKGVQTEDDQRNKEKKMLKMQTRET